MIHPLKDGIGAVTLMDYMGDDLSVVNAARVSMAKVSTEMCPEDAKLICYLARHNHWTPFSHPQVQLRIKMPIFVARQWFKHQIGFTRNEVSRRYVDDTPEFYEPSDWRLRAPSVKQGSLEETIDLDMGSDTEHAEYAYLFLLKSGVAPEMARMVLPQSTYTEFVETGSLAAYARLAKLRLDPHAQKEVRVYAQAVADIIRPLFPVSWDALL